MTWTNLRDQINDVFSGEEFASLCFELGLSADQWTVETKTRKIELCLLTLYEKGRLNALGAALHRLRPKQWPEATLDFSTTAPPFEAAPVSQTIINTAGGMVNQGKITAGGDVVGRDKNIHIHAPQWLLLISVVCVGLIYLLGPVLFKTPQPQPTATAIFPVTPQLTLAITPTVSKTPEQDPILSEGPDETLILIATFARAEGVKDAKPHKEIRDAILAAAKEMSNNDPKINLRVEIVPSQLAGDEQAPATALGQRYNASLIIWGNETAVRTTVNFLNLKQPKANASQVKISETERSQLADPKAYVQMVTRDLPNQMRFLALFAVGQAYVQKGKHGYESSFKAIDSAVKTQLPVSPTITGLADAYFSLGWLNDELKRELTQTIKLYDRVIALDKNFALAYNNRGFAYAALTQPQRAIQDYDKAIEIDKNFALAYINRGIAYVALTQPQLAIQDYDKAIEIDKNFAWAYNNRGIAYVALKQPQRAIQDYNKAIEIDKNLAFAYINRGIAYATLTEPQRAIQDFDKAVEIDKNFADTYINRGIVYNSLKQYQRAIQEFDKAIEVNQNYAVAYNNRGIVYLNGLKEYQRSIQDFDKAIGINQNFAWAYNNRGNAYMKLKQYQSAIQDFDKAIGIDKDYAAAYSNRGLAYNNQKQYQRAIQDFNKAIDLDKNFAFAYQNRGLAYYYLNQYQRTIQDFKKYLELAPSAEDRTEIEKIIKDLEALLP